MRVLVVGGGGREHALVWKLKQSPHVTALFVSEGNAGTAALATNLGLTQSQQILWWVKKNPMDLVVVAQDSFLAEGLVDQLQATGSLVFGPTKAAAEIEWSKAYAKQFMREARIPTARYEVCTSIDAARAYIRTQSFPLVVKASGLALGKGVVIARTLAEADAAITHMMERSVFGAAGAEVVIEEFLVGREISIHALCDGDEALLFPAAQDHKHIFDGDTGPMTGGMGTIAPVPWVTPEIMQEIETKVVLPTLRALKARGRPFKGLLFPGIMITAEGPKVIEYNARFGDPETQSYVRLLESDLFEALVASAKGDLFSTELTWSNKTAATIVAASGGYPGEYKKGCLIHGIDGAEHFTNVTVFQAGTKTESAQLKTNGGRVLGVSALGTSLPQALHKAYEAIEQIHFEGMQYRKDIGQKSLSSSDILNA